MITKEKKTKKRILEERHTRVEICDGRNHDGLLYCAVRGSPLKKRIFTRKEKELSGVKVGKGVTITGELFHQLNGSGRKVSTAFVA